MRKFVDVRSRAAGRSGPASSLLPLLVLVLAGAFAWTLTSPAGLQAEEPAPATDVAARRAFFQRHVAPLLEARCLGCHNQREAKGGLSLQTAGRALEGGDSGQVIVPGDPAGSYLLELVTARGGSAAMPKDADPLEPAEVERLRTWIRDGANWPDELRLEPARVTSFDWWSRRPLSRPDVPQIEGARREWTRNPIDCFIAARHAEHQLRPAPEADRRTLIRRVYFDLIGLPPTAGEIRAFVADSDPASYERLVDRLLASPRYGERWARHWLDVVHYADTHGYDKDKPRPNAWPYRDYVIRSLNADKPYSRFVMEQVAGDVLFPASPRSVEATGFIAAGPWDFIGHAEVPESKTDGKVARNLDRDDMVSTTMNTFTSVTVQCARCHNHKFDPVTQEHYYSLQAVFAALDRAERPYDADPRVAARRRQLQQRIDTAQRQQAEIQQRLAAVKTPRILELERRMEGIQRRQAAAESTANRSPAYGYHSQVASDPQTPKWVQVDLGQPLAIDRVWLFGANEYGWADFGFPLRFRVEMANALEPGEPGTLRQPAMVADFTRSDFPRPGAAPVVFDTPGRTARYIRVTATRLWERRKRGETGGGDFIFALGELAVTSGGRLIVPREVQALDSIEAPPRWSRPNLIDGVYGTHTLDQLATADEAPADRKGLERQAALLERYFADSGAASLPGLIAERDELLEEAAPDLAGQRNRVAAELDEARRELADLPAPAQVYAGVVHQGSGNFRGRHGLGPRPIHLLHRGDVTKPGREVGPGAIPLRAGDESAFDLPPEHEEGQRRAALARWLVDRDHPLTWRSIANRLWLYHFGRGIVDSPNDFGRMGQLPTHPELLDWLAVELRDGPPRASALQSWKHVHRLIVTSSTYRQASLGREDQQQIDQGNRFLWKMNRRRLEAEAVRDSVLLACGKLDFSMYGPGFQDFVIEKPQHSPHYQYHLHDPDDPASHRRAVYRFLVRSQQQPFMETLDCADPSQRVAKRSETLTSLQALALLNNRFMLRMAEHLAQRVGDECDEPAERVRRACRLVLGREPTPEESGELQRFCDQHGLANTCRLLFNLNEFLFVD